MKQRIYHNALLHPTDDKSVIEQATVISQRIVDFNKLNDVMVEYRSKFQFYTDGSARFELWIDVPGVNWPKLIWFLVCLAILITLAVGGQ